MSINQPQPRWEELRTRPMTPLKAKKIMAALGLRRADLASFLTMPNGPRPSNPTVGHILNRGYWPERSASRSMLQSQLKAFLRQSGAAEEDVEVALEIDDGLFQPSSTDQDRARLGQATAPIADEETQLPENEMLSQLARRHFSLFRDPFMDDVQGPDDVFLSPGQRYIREYMFSTAKHGGFLAVIGESGAGKSVLRRDLLDRIQRDGESITPIMPRIIDKGRLTAGAVCDSIIADISQERPRKELEAKARQIERLLTDSSRGGNSHVLIIEEAHDLTIPTLKYLKRFWELEDGFRRLLSIILVGQPELRGTLDERRNRQACEVIRRIEVAEMEPLNGHLQEYLTLKFKRIGKELAACFDPDAFGVMEERLMLRSRSSREPISMLYPLVVNNLVVKCMNLAAEVGSQKVNAEIVKGV
ncbi:Type II secretory pathway, component ExeA (predicted ATPase) [Aquisalimonas asiatica]|uniref:Type II secretory pathway, component ExeA (Predicted ATPase) n=2 Tax=Aquisalimonas asiatica TaxID=406100 RepID=A0A1H8RT63_9GAMM|nr:Type II secretory pathway, component ExeA (predicted ATPase) [Aquisalimonas asiatica]